MESTHFLTSPVVLAIIVFLGIYLLFFLIRVLADMAIFGIVLGCSVAVYSIQGFDLYDDFRNFFVTDLKITAKLGLIISEQPDAISLITMATIIGLVGLAICLPFLPFSETYRKILGVERLSRVEQAKIQAWIRSEIELDRIKHQRDDDND